MRFCQVCDNMLYMTLGGDKDSYSLLFVCRNCGNTVTAEANSEDCVVDASHVDEQVNLQQYMNENIIYDPTLPVVDNIKCPNPTCSRPAEAGNRVIYVKVDAVAMTYLYHCCHCSQFWNLK